MWNRVLDSVAMEKYFKRVIKENREAILEDPHLKWDCNYDVADFIERPLGHRVKFHDDGIGIDFDFKFVAIQAAIEFICPRIPEDYRNLMSYRKVAIDISRSILEQYDEKENAILLTLQLGKTLSRLEFVEGKISRYQPKGIFRRITGFYTYGESKIESPKALALDLIDPMFLQNAQQELFAEILLVPDFENSVTLTQVAYKFKGQDRKHDLKTLRNEVGIMIKKAGERRERLNGQSYQDCLDGKFTHRFGKFGYFPMKGTESIEQPTV